MSIIPFLPTRNTIPKSFSPIWLPCLHPQQEPRRRKFNSSLAPSPLAPISASTSADHPTMQKMLHSSSTSTPTTSRQKYHIIYDDKFQTIQHSNKNNEIWTKLFIRQLQTKLTSPETSIQPKILRNHLSNSSSNTTHPTNNAQINTSTLRSGRLSRPPRRLAYFSEHDSSSPTSFDIFISTLQDKLSEINSQAIHTLTKCSTLQAHTAPISFSNDSPTSKQALTGPHSSDFLQAEQANCAN